MSSPTPSATGHLFMHVQQQQERSGATGFIDLDLTNPLVNAALKCAYPPRKKVPIEILTYHVLSLDHRRDGYHAAVCASTGAATKSSSPPWREHLRRISKQRACHGVRAGRGKREASHDASITVSSSLIHMGALMGRLSCALYTFTVQQLWCVGVSVSLDLFAKCMFEMLGDSPSLGEALCGTLNFASPERHVGHCGHGS